ncbi:putative short-chain dehydrogenase/reductase [Burkholderia mallei]|nr:putative short-chain dehydrogenase/reductase [Burkholderia mallei]
MPDRHALAREPFTDAVDAALAHVPQMQARARQQRGEDVHHRRVEAVVRQQRHPVVVVKADRRRVARGVVQHIAVALHHALRHAGRARREQQIRNRVAAARVERAVRRRQARVVDDARRDAEARGRLGELGRGEHEPAAALAHDRLQVRQRMVGDQRNVELAGAEHAEHRGDHRRAVRIEERDRFAARLARRANRFGDAARACRKRAVRPAFVAARHRERIAPARGHVGESRRQRIGGGDLGRGRRREPPAESVRSHRCELARVSHVVNAHRLSRYWPSAKEGTERRRHAAHSAVPARVPDRRAST